VLFCFTHKYKHEYYATNYYILYYK
jgi:hypothetical protein